MVLFPKEKVNSKNWFHKAKNIIEIFTRVSNIKILLGNLIKIDKCPSGYTYSLSINGACYYFAIAIHQFCHDMGILVKFSAHAWAVYQYKYSEHFGKETNIQRFLKSIQNDMYKVRLSRIDFTADYMNYGKKYSPDFIYRKIKSGDFLISDKKGKVTNRKLSALEKSGKAETVYIGSRKNNSQLLIRIYDKKEEQINQAGFRLNEAMKCENWTRLEVSFRGDYAHQITDILLIELKDDDNTLSHFIADKITEKFILTDKKKKCHTEFTSNILKLSNSTFSALRSEKPKNNELAKTIAYILNNSGLLSTLYKVRSVWGKEYEKIFLKKIYDIYLNDYLNKFNDNLKLKNWVKYNRNSLSTQTLDDCFIRSYYLNDKKQ